MRNITNLNLCIVETPERIVCKMVKTQMGSGGISWVSAMFVNAKSVFREMNTM